METIIAVAQIAFLLAVAFILAWLYWRSRRAGHASDLETHFKEKDHQISNLENQVYSISQETESLQSRLEEKESELFSFNQSLADLQLERDALARQVQDRNDQIRTLEQRLAEQGAEMRKSKETYEAQLSASLRNAEYLAEKVQRLVESTEANSRKLSEGKPYATQIAEQQSTIQALKQQLSQKEMELHHFQQQQTTQKTELDDYKRLIDLWDVQNLEKSNELERLREENEFLRKEAENREQLIEDQGTQQDKLEDELNELHRIHAEQKATLERIQGEFGKVTAEFIQLQEELAAHHMGDHQQIAQEMADLEAALVRMKLDNQDLLQQKESALTELNHTLAAFPKMDQEAFYAIAQDHADKEAELIRLRMEHDQWQTLAEEKTQQFTRHLEAFEESYAGLEPEKLQALGQEIADKEAELVRLSLEKAEWQREAEARASQLEEKEEALRTLQESHMALDAAHVEQLAQEMADKEAELVRISLEKAEWQQQAEARDRQLAEKELSLSQLQESQITLDAARMEQLAQEMADKEAALVRLSLEKAEWQQQAEARDRQLAEKELSLSQLQESQITLDAERMEQLAQEMADKEAELVRLSLEKAEWQQQAEARDLQLTEKEHALFQLQESQITLDAERMEQLAQEMADKEAELVRLSLEKAEWQQQAEARDLQLAEKELSLSQLQESQIALDAERMEQLAQEMADKEAELVRLSLEKAEWQQQAEARDLQLTEKEHALFQLQESQIALDAERMEQLAQEMADKEAELVRLSLEKAEWQQQAEARDRQLTEKEHALFQLQESQITLDAERMEQLAQEMADKEAELVRLSLEKAEWQEKAVQQLVAVEANGHYASTPANGAYEVPATEHWEQAIADKEAEVARLAMENQQLREAMTHAQHAWELQQAENPSPEIVAQLEDELSQLRAEQAGQQHLIEQLQGTQATLESEKLRLQEEIEARSQAETSSEKEPEYMPEAIYQLIVKDSSDGISVSDQDGYFLVYNDKLQEITGYDREEANRYSIDGSFLSRLYPDSSYLQKVVDEIAHIPEDGYHHVKSFLTSKQGETKELLVASTCIFYEGKKYFLSAYREAAEALADDDYPSEEVREIPM